MTITIDACFKAEPLDGIIHRRRTEWAKKISQSDHSISNFGKKSVKISKKVNSSRDLILKLTEYKNGRNIQRVGI